MRKVLLILAGIAVLAAGPLGAQVTVREVRMDIPTYVTGPDDPAPPFGAPRVYPYPMQTAITRDKVLKTYRVVVLENEYIRVLILPDLGGRILAALDKTNDDFDFIYYNHVIKPGLVALRGAWLSGGIEWNFPTLGHTVNTVAPVKYAVLKGADGRATCVVGTEEWVRRMKWEVSIELSPGRACFRTGIRLENRTLTHNNGYFWANAAVHDWNDTRVIFPPTDYTYAGGRSHPTPWPIFEGRDVSWVKNTAVPYDYFCGAPGDFNAAYNYDHENGTAHYADREDSPGKKFWTWGTAPSGAIWEDLLTDADGQYIEVQSGRLLTQGDTWIFDPLLVEEWSEWWYPLKKMHGLVKANRDAAVNLEVRESGVFVALNVTAEVLGARLGLSRDGAEIFSQTIDLTPAGYYQREVPLARPDGVFVLSLRDGRGRTIIDYSTERPAIPPPELQPVITEAEAVTAQARYLQGYYALKHWDAESAAARFRQSLAIDPEFTPALRWLGILDFKAGRTREALALFDRALGRDEDDHVARYYRALSRLRLGIDERVEADLALAARRAATRPAAAYALAARTAGGGDLDRSLSWLERALAASPSSTKIRVLKAAVERRLGRREAARETLAPVLRSDPIDSLAWLESRLENEEVSLDLLRHNPEYFLEAAADYAEFGLTDDALRVIDLGLAGDRPRPYPMLHYGRGFYNLKLGRRDEAVQDFNSAAAAPLDYAFPFRTEAEEILRAALRFNPSDWKARYLLGTLLTAKLRWEEGLAEFQRAAEASPPWAMLYRNLGELLWKRAGRLGEAARMYDRALSLERDDWRLYGALDELYALTGEAASRDRLFTDAPASVQKNFNFILKKAQYRVETGDYGAALNLLRVNTFLPWEGWTNAHQVYVAANLRQALALMSGKKYDRAVSHLRAAKEYPSNLGTGRPAAPAFGVQDYYLGVCFESMGRRAEAEARFREAVAAGESGREEAVYYRALALRRLGREAEARSALEKMRAAAEQALTAGGGINGRTAYEAALACQGLGLTARAAEHFQTAVRLEPSLRWTSLLPLEQEARLE
jgi:tetratricopeptide (TPR) repeat protein